MCPDCERSLDRTKDFYRNKKGSASGYCRECTKSRSETQRREKGEAYNAYLKGYYEANKDVIKARSSARHEEGARLVSEIKSSAPCSDCGKPFPPYVMDFDHARGSKLKNVSQLKSHKTETLEAEISKCDLVCANCHRIRTVERGLAGGRPLSDQSGSLSIRARDYRKKRREAHPGWGGAVSERQAAARVFVRSAKANRPCVDCGQSFHSFVMDFDHRDPASKVMGISALVSAAKTVDLIAAEITKCDLICANCHRGRTYARGQMCGGYYGASG